MMDRASAKNVGLKTSSLALLGVSAALLLAAGETLRHAHASAFGGGGGATPMPGIVLSAMMAAESAAVAKAAHAAASAKTTAEAESTPIIWSAFRPFVLVRIPYNQGTYTNGGEVMGLSNHGQDLKAIAVGYLVDGDEDPQPFMFTAATNTVAMLDMGSGAYESGMAMAISPDGEHIAGWAYHTSSSTMRAVVWEAPNYQINSNLFSNTDAGWIAVNNDGVAAGAFDASGHWESVVGNGGPGYPFSGSEGEAKGINAAGRVCGWYWHGSQHSHAYRWDSLSGGNDIHPTGQQGYGDDSGANCINSTHHIGGWVVNQYGKHISAHWIPMSLQGVHYEVSALGGGDTSSHEVVAINSRTEMLLNRVDDIRAIALWIDNSAVNEAVVIDEPHVAEDSSHLILMPNIDDRIYMGRCLNDDLWIGGSYQVHGEGDPQPCLAVPYDVDNNGHPDIREILESKTGENQYELDQYVLKWLLDAGENVGYPVGGMRIGLNDPGYLDEDTQGIANVQVVRLPLGVHNPDFASAGPEEFYVNGILHVGEGSQCSDFQSGLNNWREGREIVLTLRSNLDDSDPDHDYLPTAPNVDLGQGITKQHLLTNLHKFGYKFARCVDWIQLGNESFSSTDPESVHFGHGGYMIWAEEVGDCWTTGLNPREFEDITCPIPAIEAVQAWHYEQMWSILEGSALAGRPLRIIGPAVPMYVVIESYQEDTTLGWKVIDRTAAWCNDYQVWFDMHARYLERPDVSDALGNLLSGGSGYPGEWSVAGPYRTVCLELAPKLKEDLNWWTGGANDKFDRLMGIPECDAGNGTWEDFLIGQEGWHQAQFGNEVNFGWGDAVGPLYDARLTIVCYGSTLQGSVVDPLWDLAALRCQNACAENFPNNEPRFSPLKGYYETAASNYQIPDFDPHENACASCPGN